MRGKGGNKFWEQNGGGEAEEGGGKRWFTVTLNCVLIGTSIKPRE